MTLIHGRQFHVITPASSVFYYDGSLSKVRANIESSKTTMSDICIFGKGGFHVPRWTKSPNPMLNIPNPTQQGERLEMPNTVESFHLDE